MVPLSARKQRLADRYELERELNADGQSVDWLARDSALDRQVVVSLLDPELAQDATAAEHFWATARAAARTIAPSEPRILDGGTDAATGQLFVVREWRDEPASDLQPPSAPAGNGQAEPHRWRDTRRDGCSDARRDESSDTWPDGRRNA